MTDKILEVRGLTKTYGGVKKRGAKKADPTLDVLKGIDLDIYRGDVVCLIGPSGCGKSTFLRCLNRLEFADSGAISIEGKDILCASCDINAIRAEVGQDFHLQMKINGEDHNDWLYPWQKRGNSLDETLNICRLLMDDGKGVDAFHVSSGSTFPHPRNPPGDLPMRDLARWYDGLISQGTRAGFNHAIFSNRLTARLFQAYWRWRRGKVIEGINLPYARAIRAAVRAIDPGVPVICTGGFQHADTIAGAIRDGDCDAVSIARALIANNDLPRILQTANGPEPGRECTYCNKCLINDLENPLGCYEVSRFPGDSFEERYDAMIAEVMSVFDPPAFPQGATRKGGTP